MLPVAKTNIHGNVSGKGYVYNFAVPAQSIIHPSKTGKKPFLQSPSSDAWTSTTVASETSPPVDQKFNSPVLGAGSVQATGDTFPKIGSDGYNMLGTSVGGTNSRSTVRGDASGFIHNKLATSGSRRLSYPSQASPAIAQASSLSSPNRQETAASSHAYPNGKQPAFTYPAATTSYSNQSPASATTMFPPEGNFSKYEGMQDHGYNPKAQQQQINRESTSSTVTLTPSTSTMINSAAQRVVPADDKLFSESTLHESASPCAIPMFGEGCNRSPFPMADDFASWLFDTQTVPTALPTMQAGAAGSQLVGSMQFSLQAPLFSNDPAVTGYYSQQPVPPQHLMAVSSILDCATLRETGISEEKKAELLHLINTRFTPIEQDPAGKYAGDILEGDTEDKDHVLSLPMMHNYIASYWYHIHPQMPILHRPTFNADRCPDLLLLSMMALGSASLEKGYSLDVTDACASLSNRLAWHLRWEIFRDANFRPPAKLWVFQALLLLELFEKMYSSRPLHERAHIHHATTLTLMRRGSSLIGRSAMETPPSIKDGRPDSAMAPNATVPGPKEWWERWIMNEATRRAAFAAFILDSTHATMFGHSAVMSAHELRLPLPCDEALWAATSSAEVGRVDAHLRASGFTPLTFLEGLKKLLHEQSVKTNCFGRTILMAGLLSVSWHMNQRDLQLSTLGATQALGCRDRWRGAMTRAFDFWKRDFDDSLTKMSDPSGLSVNMPGYGHVPTGANTLLDAENATVLHHIAHMASHVDIVDVQIFAGASRLLGRYYSPYDYESAHKRMKETWAPTARARDATFHALRFLTQVLGQTSSPGGRTHVFAYSARDDTLLNRPWVVYFATLIIFAYGFSMDGPLRPGYALTTQQQRVDDMQRFLKRASVVATADDLQHMKDRNALLGLLILLKENFGATRWELLHEAANLLGRCIELLVRYD